VDGLCGLRRLQRLPRQALRLGKVKQLTVEEVAGAKRGVPGIQNSYIYNSHTHIYIYMGLYGYNYTVYMVLSISISISLYIYLYLYLYL
jgi:hypothetical protein